MCYFLILIVFFFFNDTATTEIYTLSLHDALPHSSARRRERADTAGSRSLDRHGRSARALCSWHRGRRRRRGRARRNRRPGDRTQRLGWDGRRVLHRRLRAVPRRNVSERRLLDDPRHAHATASDRRAPGADLPHRPRADRPRGPGRPDATVLVAERRDQCLRDDLQRPSRDLTRLAQTCERVLLGETLLLHQQALGPFDRLAGGERLGQRLRLLAQRGQLLVARSGGADRREEVLLAERLDEIPEDAGLGCALHQLVLAVGGQHHDRDRTLVQDAPGRLDAVELGHLDVEDGDIRQLGAGEGDRLLPVTGLGADLEAGPLQE